MKTPVFFLWMVSALLPAASRGSVVSWWPLDGSAVDAVGPNGGAWSGTAAYAAGVAAPGSTQAADVSNAAAPKRFIRAGAGIDFDGTQPFSAMAWIKGTAQDSTVIGDMLQGGTYRGWELHVGTTANGGNSTGVTVWLLNTYPTNAIQVGSSVNVLNNAWHHVAFTYDGSRTAAGVKIYVDGVAVAGTAALNSLTGTIANGTGAELNIGSRQNGANHTFTGLIDEAAVASHALGAAEIAGVYSSGVGSLTSPPVLASTDPRSGETVFSLTGAEVVFDRTVTGVDASDLRVNGVPAAAVQGVSGNGYRFSFPQPAPGPVVFSWAAGHGIVDSQNRAFGGAGWSVTLDPATPLPAVQIAEFLANNVGGLEDGDHDTPDWIEVLNPGPARVDLEGWSLTDDPASPQKWVFPTAVLHAGDRMVVFASGKNRRVPGSPLHGSFALESSGGHLALRRPDGSVAHAFDPYPQQEANVSFGLPPGSNPADGAVAWRHFTNATPGNANIVAGSSASAIRAVTHTPLWPADADDIVVLADIQPVTGPISSATLFYRVQHGAETAVALTPGPSGYTATIPAAASSPGQMVRWRIAVTAGGVASRWPVNESPSVALPLYLGTTIRQPTVTQLPVYETFVSGYVAPPSAAGPFHAADGDAGVRGAFAWQGKLHDNVLYRIKGTTSRYLFKRSHRVECNPGHGFEWEAGQPALRELNLNSEYVDPAYCRQYLSHWMQRESGGGGAPHFPVRVHMNGAFWQLAFHTMAADRELLRFMGLDDRGALYKQVGQLLPGAPEKENRIWESGADYSDFATGINESRTLAQRAAFLMDNADVAAVVNYLAVARLTQEADDVWANMVLHRDSEDSLLWRPVPFDLNLSFGQLFHDGQSWNTVVHATMDNNKSHPLYGSSVCRPQYPNNPAYNGWWNRLYDVVIQHPATRAMLLRRMRTLMDRFYGPPGTPYLQRPLEAELDALWARIQPEAELDRSIWGWPPVNNTPGSFGVYGLGNVPPAQAVADVKTLYLDPRRTHFYVTHSVANTAVPIGIANTANAGIPEAQPAAPALAFGAIEASPADGNQDHEYVEILNPNGYAVDASGWRIAGGISDTLDAGTVIPAGGSLHLTPSMAAFRTRTTSPKAGSSLLVQGDYNGHLSAFGETLTLLRADGSVAATVTYAGGQTPLQQWLAVSEIGYAPPGDGAAEFVELVNTSSSVTLDLTGVHFSAGIEFSFTGAPVTSLAPGQRVVVVRNRSAFEGVYGPGLPVAGEFANNTRLDNAGERLKLDDALNNTIFDVTYGTVFPWPDEGVTVLAPAQTGGYGEEASHWRLPVNAGGSPGAGDAVAFSGTTADELSAYALGDSPPATLTPEPSPGAGWVLEFFRRLAADDAELQPVVGTDLTHWSAAGVERMAEERDPERPGFVRVRCRVTVEPAEASRYFVKIRIAQRP